VEIAFALHVPGSEEAIRPRSSWAVDWSFFVVHAVVAQNRGLGGIGGKDLAPAVDNACCLIKVHGLGDVVGNDGIVLPQFGDTIHLHRQQDRYTSATQIARQQHRRSCSPTVAKENNASSILLFGGEDTVVIGIEKSDNGIIGPFSAAILENPDIGALGSSLPDTLRELNGAVVRIVVTDEATHEADHNVGSWDRSVGPNYRRVHSAR